MIRNTNKASGVASKPRPKKPQPLIGGRPKKKHSKLQQQALDRVGRMAQARKRTDPERRLAGEVALTRAWVDKAQLEVEPLLHDLMWVEYRYMGPWERTERFAEEYVAAYRRAYEKHFDALDVAKKRPLSGSLAFCSPDEINALHHARAHADALGVPYDLYCDVIMEGHLTNDKWGQPPRPNQMYGKLAGPRMQSRLTSDEIHKRLLLPHWDVRFFAESNTSDPIQEAAWKLLRQDVHSARDKAACLSEHLRYRRSISESRARELFGNDLVEEAIEYGGVPAPWRVNAVPSDRVPSCYGFPSRSVEAPCVTCPVSDGCGQVADAAVGELIEMTGTDDPRRDHRRKVDRDRQRRNRERKRRERAQYAAGPTIIPPHPRAGRVGGSEADGYDPTPPVDDDPDAFLASL